jgi:uncharacterized membrane protein
MVGRWVGTGVVVLATGFGLVVLVRFLYSVDLAAANEWAGVLALLLAYVVASRLSSPSCPARATPTAAP